MKRARSLFLAALGLLFPLLLSAQEPRRGSLDSTQVLGESVVTAFRQPDKVIPAQTLQGEQL